MPSPATVNVVRLHEVFTVEVVAHKRTVLGANVAGEVTVSFVRTEIVWFVSYAPDDVSLTATGGAGITGVKVEVAVWPKMSVTLYVIGVFVPSVAFTSATYVTTPVDAFNVYVPSPAMVTTPSASHVVVPGVSKHVAEGFRPTVEEPKPPVPVTVVNVAVPPANTAFVSGVAAGPAGGSTNGVIVAATVRPRMSVTTYFTGAAVPTKLGNGSNVTTPVVLFTV